MLFYFDSFFLSLAARLFFRILAMLFKKQLGAVRDQLLKTRTRKWVAVRIGAIKVCANTHYVSRRRSGIHRKSIQSLSFFSFFRRIKMYSYLSHYNHIVKKNTLFYSAKKKWDSVKCKCNPFGCRGIVYL